MNLFYKVRNIMWRRQLFFFLHDFIIFFDMSYEELLWLQNVSVEKPIVFIVEEKENLAQVQLGQILFSVN